MSSNLIIELTFQLGVEVLIYAEELKNKKHYALADQIIRAGLSIGANMNEAQGAESRADFIHKCKISYKEAEEVRFFLRVIKAVPSYPFSEPLMNSNGSVINVLGKIIATAKGRK